MLQIKLVLAIIVMIGAGGGYLYINKLQKDKWIKCIDQCIRIDKFSLQQIYLICKHIRQDEFWSEYDPDQKTQRHIPKIFNPRPTPKPKTLKAIRRQLAEGKHV